MQITIHADKILDAEVEGKTPFPGISDLRDWDLKLLSRYRANYLGNKTNCDMCTHGVCDLDRNKKGCCGIKLKESAARYVLLTNCIGTSAHLAHASELVETAINRKGAFADIVVRNINIVMPVAELISGIKPTKLIHLRQIVNYCSEQLTICLASCAMGQESDANDYESKSLHVGMIDILAMEIADIAQIIAYDFDCKSELVKFGFDVDCEKPFILFIGHNVKAGAVTSEYLKSNDVEIGGLCCTAHDITRHNHNARIIGSMSDQLLFIKSGIADVIVLDEQCIRADVVELAKKNNAIVITTSAKNIGGLKDIGAYTREDAVNYLLEVGAGFIDNLELLPGVIVDVAKRIHEKRKEEKLKIKNLSYSVADACVHCGLCRKNCLHDLAVDDAIYGLREGRKKIVELNEKCIHCGRCESACPRQIPIVELMLKASIEKLTKPAYIRAGKGPISETEIRGVGTGVVLGEIPGIIAIAGCPNHTEASKIALIAKEFTARNYIVLVSGCAAMQIAKYSELYKDAITELSGGCLINTGSCVSNAHIAGAALKIPAIFARLKLKGNYKEIADYIINRIGAVGIAYGAMSQKASAIISGFNRLGVPVILGPKGRKYNRLLLSDKDTKWELFDRKSGKIVDGEPAPEHLLLVADSVEEAIVTASKLCMRPNDTARGRQIKLLHYIDLHKKYLGKEPEDIEKFIRSKQDIPAEYVDKIKAGYREAIDPSLL